VSAADAATGKARATWETFTTKVDAARARDAQHHDRSSGRFVFPERVTGADWIASFLAARAAGIKSSTAESYEVMSQQVTSHLGGLKLQDLNAERIQAFERSPSTRMPPGTVRGVMRLLKSAISLGVATSGGG